MSAHHRFSISLFIGLALVSPEPASAQEPTKVVAVMKAINEAWQEAIKDQKLFLQRCGDGKFTAYRLTAASTTTYDVRKTDSLIQPHLGIVRISAHFQSNSGRKAVGNLNKGPGKGDCFATEAEAFAASKPDDFTPPNKLAEEMVAYYAITEDKAILRDGNRSFNLVFFSHMQYPENQGWAPLLTRALP